MKNMRAVFLLMVAVTSFVSVILSALPPLPLAVAAAFLIPLFLAFRIPCTRSIEMAYLFAFASLSMLPLSIRLYYSFPFLVPYGENTKEIVKMLLDRGIIISLYSFFIMTELLLGRIVMEYI